MVEYLDVHDVGFLVRILFWNISEKKPLVLSYVIFR
jgi:hypothetical protein